jgi:chemotaxis regulatin CheY-phosphate phosphatase CheZ
MDHTKKTTSKRNASHDPSNPDSILKEIRERNALLEARLDKLTDIITEIRTDIKDGADQDLSVLSRASIDMLNGRVYQQQIDTQAKGELGILVKIFNQTLSNLQQLDATVKDQSTKVPELAAQLDSITADTEKATQNVMNRLDILMARAEDAGRFFSEVQRNTEGYRANQDYLVGGITEFLERAKTGGNTTDLAQEILDYVFAFEVSPKPEPLDLSVGQSMLQIVSDEAFEILNILQFQDITRQKTEKVIQLLKQFRQSLDRLLTIFKISEEEIKEEDAVFENRNVATQDNIFKTGITANSDSGSIDDIIAQFKAKP